MGNEAERYNLIQEKSGLSKQDFANSIGLIKSHGSLISTGRQKLSREGLQTLSRLYNVNLHWYLTGEGLSGFEADTVDIELYDQEAAAGFGRDIEDFPELKYLSIPKSFFHPHKPENLKAVYVSGDSMIDERIYNGDIAIFNVKQTEGNGIYVVSVGNTLVVKRVDFDTSSQTLTLISANPAYEPRRYAGLELEGIKVVGRVVACYHKI